MAGLTKKINLFRPRYSWQILYEGLLCMEKCRSHDFRSCFPLGTSNNTSVVYTFVSCFNQICYVKGWLFILTLHSVACSCMSFMAALRNELQFCIFCNGNFQCFETGLLWDCPCRFGGSSWPSSNCNIVQVFNSVLLKTTWVRCIIYCYHLFFFLIVYLTWSFSSKNSRICCKKAKNRVLCKLFCQTSSFPRDW